MAKNGIGQNSYETVVNTPGAIGDFTSGLFGGSTSTSSGSTQEYTKQSLLDLYALGGNLTQYTDTLESLSDYAPDKYEANYTDTKTQTGVNWKGEAQYSTVRNYEDAFLEASEFSELSDPLMAQFTKRLSSIQTQKDQPGRTQLLGNQSLLG